MHLIFGLKLSSLDGPGLHTILNVDWGFELAWLVCAVGTPEDCVAEGSLPHPASASHNPLPLLCSAEKTNLKYSHNFIFIVATNFSLNTKGYNCLIHSYVFNLNRWKLFINAKYNGFSFKCDVFGGNIFLPASESQFCETDNFLKHISPCAKKFYCHPVYIKVTTNNTNSSSSKE